MKKALIAGITGQDGSYLAEILLDKGYEVHGIIRDSATGNTKNIEPIMDRIYLHKGDLREPLSIYRAIKKADPDEIYNEADQDHVGWGEETPSQSFDVTGAAVGRFLEMVKEVNPKIKYFQPLSSNIFGKLENENVLQTEETPRNPQSNYACAKSFAFDLVRKYRDVHGLFASSGIFYNHESPRRTQKYFTHKVTRAAVEISKGLRDKLEVGDLNLKVDWGYAKEYMEAAWNILQLDKPDDFIICTGEVHSLKEFLDGAFKKVGLDYKDYVQVNPKFIRGAKTSTLCGNYSKAKKAFGFEPKVKFKEIIKMLIEHDIEEVEKELEEKRDS